MFIDETTITVKSGAGGDGCMSFRREKYVPRGGPDGGDGGNGGSVIFCTDSNLATLVDLRYQTRIEAGRGQHGKGKNLTGGRGANAIVRMPPGTVVHNEAGNILADLVAEDESFTLLKGGQGGRGNARFATSRNQAPRHCEPGTPGEEVTVRLELKLLADVGLVGFPNAGKSTLLSRLSAAHPKIADYPFTTLQPNLGIVRHGEYESFVLADLPGLIKGAHEGKGLGLRFLKHVERTRLLLITLECTAENAAEQMTTLRAELGQHNPALLKKPCAIVYTKADLLGPATDNFEDPLAELSARRFLISAVSGAGLAELVTYLGQQVSRQRGAEAAVRGDGSPKRP
ncbi:MAG: GTPase ObgE [Candidatus Latescibacterota bacterium]|nr:GTPase ObgE [Candidatus Latescibacterota bacterium]